MQLESKIYYSNCDIQKCEKFDYSLAGMGGTGDLSIIKGFTPTGTYYVYIRCSAGLKNVFKMFDFEGLSIWETEKDGELNFLSFEEKDSIKKIYKKWEFNAGQLQYIENRNGLVQEREVSYSLVGLASEHRVFDPLSVVAFLRLEKLKPNGLNTFYIFGKQQLLKLNLEAFQEESGIRVQFRSDGMKSQWEKTLEKAEMYLNKEGYIESVTTPSPFFMGKIEMKIQQKEEVSVKNLEELIKKFHESKN